MTPVDLNHVENMKVATPKIAEGDTNWYVCTANDWIVRGPYERKHEALAQLNEIRRLAYLEYEEEQEDE